MRKTSVLPSFLFVPDVTRWYHDAASFVWCPRSVRSNSNSWKVARKVYTKSKHDSFRFDWRDFCLEFSFDSSERFFFCSCSVSKSFEFSSLSALKYFTLIISFTFRSSFLKLSNFIRLYYLLWSTVENFIIELSYNNCTGNVHYLGKVHYLI